MHAASNALVRHSKTKLFFSDDCDFDFARYASEKPQNGDCLRNSMKSG